jgi:hypothetical protein
MANAQKNNKTNGIETQTSQKNMKSTAKRQTTQDPQTSKWQRRHVQFPPPAGRFSTKDSSFWETFQDTTKTAASVHNDS